MLIIVSKNRTFVSSLARLLRVSDQETVHVQAIEDVMRSESLNQSKGLVLDAPAITGEDLSYCQRFKRKNRDLRIMVVCAELRPETELVLMEHGVDIYSDDPPNLFLAKISKFKGLLQADNQESQIQIGTDLLLDLPSRQLFKRGKRIPLPNKEFELLHYFCQNVGRALSTEVLLQKVWDEHTDPERVRRYVAKLRQKIEEDPADPKHLIHQRGVGYLFMTHSPSEIPNTR